MGELLNLFVIKSPMSAIRSFGQHSAVDSFAEGFAVMENPNLPINVSATDLPTNRDQWKSDRSCLICKAVFKLLQHKYRCKFCYRGVCNHCSEHLFLHPEMGILKRCCNSCYKRFLTYTLREELAGKIYASQGRLTVIEDQLAESQERKRENQATLKDLESDIRRKRLKFVQSESTYERELREKKQKLTQAKKAKEQIREHRSKVTQKIDEYRSLSSQRCKEKEEHRKSLFTCEAQTRALKSQLCQLQEEANLILHSHAVRSQSLSPPLDCYTLPGKGEVSENDEVLDTEASVSKDAEAGETYEMGSPVSDDFDQYCEHKHLQRLLADLESENVALRTNLSTSARPGIVSERLISATPRSEVRAAPNRSCCVVF